MLNLKADIPMQLLTCCILLILLSSKAGYANELQIVTEILPPYQTRTTEGELSGMSTEIVAALLREVERQAPIEVFPWARAYRIATTRANTLIFSLARNSFRENKFHWVGQLDKENVYYWSLAKNRERLSSIDKHDKSIMIGAMADSNIELYLKNSGHTNYHTTVDEDQILKMLHLGRIDLLIEAELTFLMRLEALGLKRQNFARLQQVVPLSTDLYIALSKESDPHLVTQFQNAYQKLKASGTVDCIRLKWKRFDKKKSDAQTSC